MAEKRYYTIGKSRMKRACVYGFEKTQDGGLVMTEGFRHLVFFSRLNSMEQDTAWGRFRMEADIPSECICIVRAFAMNEEYRSDGRKIDEYFGSGQVTPAEKKRFFENKGCGRAVNSRNLLLYRQKGQYLWICVEIIGKGEGGIGSIRMSCPGDNFMQTFPDIYREEGNFFHRYMSVFSSIYGDLQDKIDDAALYLDLDTAPKELLSMYAGWLGLDIQGVFLEDAVLRRLLKSAYRLNRIKGTSKAIRELIWILTGKQAIVVERSLLSDSITPQYRKIYDSLYGKGEQDVTVLINGRAEEKRKARLLFLLKQYKPVRARIKLVFYGDCSSMDSYCYMDCNARLLDIPSGVLDGGQFYNEAVLC